MQRLNDMNLNTKFYMWLTQVPGLGTVSQRRLLECFKDPMKIYEADFSELSAVGGIKGQQVSNIIEYRNLDVAEKIIDSCIKNRIETITLHDDFYPKKATKDINAPIILYSKGEVNIDKLDKTVGIVGARRCTQEDKYFAADIASRFVADGYSVVSGMAKGIDSYGHTVCLNNDGYTVAVLGNGLDICYPKEHQFLMQRIAESGLLISEYPPGTEPCKYNFPRRNRIIAQWSDILIVIGAGKGSGSLITAEYATRIGLEVKMINC